MSQTWFILIADPLREMKAQTFLKARGREVYLPTMYRVQNAGRKQTREVQRAMFPCYMFTPELIEFDLLRQVPGARGYLKLNGDPQGRSAFITCDYVEAIQAKERELEEKRQRTLAAKRGGNYGALQVGSRVSIKIGPWANLIGTIEEKSDKDRMQVVLDMALFCRDQMRVTVQKSEVVAI